MGKFQDDALLSRAQSAFDAGRLPEARGICEQLLQRNDKNLDALALLGQVAFAQGLFEDAASHVLKLAALRPRDPRPQLMLGDIRTFQGRYDEAVTRYDRVLRAEPANTRAIESKADALERCGERAKAHALLQPFLEAGEETPEMAVTQARIDGHERNHQAVIDLLTRHLDRGQAGGVTVRGMCFHLGRALERTGRFDEAFAAYEKANAAVPSPFDAEAWIRYTDNLIETFSPQRFPLLPRAAGDTGLAVFIVGMPRCGSTLVETIISAHPETHAAGEFEAMHEIVGSISLTIGSDLPYPACVEDLEQEDVDTLSRAYLDRLSGLDREAKRITDKYLTNYRHLGLIAILFPRARIIHCRRNPLDTCLSCFAQTLMPATNPFACDLRNLGTAYLEYERLVAHWRDVLEIPMLEVQYEALVADQERLSRRIIEFCGLEWDERCLRFHEAGRVVQTASYDQVTRPVYSSSVGRYKGFEKHLGPLKEVLAGGGWTEEALRGAAT
jgi:tetratricopeptide (TPR) repeat protein